MDQWKYMDGNLYFWLFEKNWEYFSDISINIEWLKKNEFAINSDFINCCFSNINECITWLHEYFDIKNIENNGYYTIVTL